MSQFLDKKNFCKILYKLGIKEKDKLLVSSNILNLVLSKKNKINPEQIIDILKKIVTPNGTLMFPTYNWEFCKKKKFNYKKTKSLTGALSNLSLKKNWT